MLWNKQIKLHSAYCILCLSNFLQEFCWHLILPTKFIFCHDRNLRDFLLEKACDCWIADCIAYLINKSISTYRNNFRLGIPEITFWQGRIRIWNVASLKLSFSFLLRRPIFQGRFFLIYYVSIGSLIFKFDHFRKIKSYTGV